GARGEPVPQPAVLDRAGTARRAGGAVAARRSRLRPGPLPRLRLRNLGGHGGAGDAGRIGRVVAGVEAADAAVPELARTPRSPRPRAPGRRPRRVPPRPLRA